MKTKNKYWFALIMILGAVIMLTTNCKKSDSTTTTNTPTAANTASGTFTWNSGTGVLIFIWKTSNFKCGGGPEIGTETDSGIIVTSTTMTFSEEMTFSRTGGTAGDIIGKWTGTDSSTGNTYTLTFNSDGTVTLVVNIVVNLCFETLSQHWENDGSYRVQLSYEDPNKSATAVNVTGPGITGSKVLTFNSNRGKWDSSTLPSTPVIFGTSYPTPPLTYTFSVTDATGTWTATSKVSCFQELFASNLSPTGTTSGTFTFTWTGINDANAMYQVQLSDNNYNRIWNSQETSGTSMIYSGPGLTSGATYSYIVVITKSSTCNGESYAQESFIYQ
jgi:hypothetical protein